ncbi:MAG TPA: UvrB/UvrC motif-containing protein, partial [Gammaproteobacteria bacterium]|nr:UvrB/UvrC motif-containing protein [Gammaproteobacteria bacterium]
ALDETDRRRAKQVTYNQVHGITPLGIQKAVADIMEGARGPAGASRGAYLKAADERGKYEAMTPEKRLKLIKQLEQQMHKHARDLEFEEAAKLRDRIRQLQEIDMGLPQTA